MFVCIDALLYFYVWASVCSGVFFFFQMSERAVAYLHLCVCVSVRTKAGAVRVEPSSGAPGLSPPPAAAAAGLNWTGVSIHSAIPKEHR